MYAAVPPFMHMLSWRGACLNKGHDCHSLDSDEDLHIPCVSLK